MPPALFPYIVLQLLFYTADPLAVPMLGIQLVRGYIANMINDLSNNGFTQTALTRFITDTQTLHFWVLVVGPKEEILIRALKYVLLETTMLGFGEVGQ
jgi:hypothetical protein